MKDLEQVREALELLIEEATTARDLDNVNYLYGAFASDSEGLNLAKQALTKLDYYIKRIDKTEQKGELNE